jgi:uncharacterized protein YdcH (DUF465 family)
MFENDQDIVENLLHEDNSFKHMYDKYCQIKQKVTKANDGAHPMDDLYLEALKKEKLYMKDRMTAMIEDYRSLLV